MCAYPEPLYPDTQVRTEGEACTHLNAVITRHRERN